MQESFGLGIPVTHLINESIIYWGQCELTLCTDSATVSVNQSVCPEYRPDSAMSRMEKTG